MLSFRSLLYILEINPLSDVWYKNIFFNLVVYIFTLSVVSFDVQNFIIFTKSNLPVFYFSYFCLSNHIEEIIPSDVMKLLSYVFFK